MHFPALSRLASECRCSARAAAPAPWCALLVELQACERRLGTAEERPGDFERAREIAHEINNRRTVAHLAEYLRQHPAEYPGTQKVA